MPSVRTQWMCLCLYKFHLAWDCFPVPLLWIARCHLSLPYYHLSLSTVHTYAVRVYASSLLIYSGLHISHVAGDYLPGSDWLGTCFYFPSSITNDYIGLCWYWWFNYNVKMSISFVTVQHGVWYGLVCECNYCYIRSTMRFCHKVCIRHFEFRYKIVIIEYCLQYRGDIIFGLSITNWCR